MIKPLKCQGSNIIMHWTQTPLSYLLFHVSYMFHLSNVKYFSKSEFPLPPLPSSPPFYRVIPTTADGCTPRGRQVTVSPHHRRLGAPPAAPSLSHGCPSSQKRRSHTLLTPHSQSRRRGLDKDKDLWNIFLGTNNHYRFSPHLSVGVKTCERCVLCGVGSELDVLLQFLMVFQRQ